MNVERRFQITNFLLRNQTDRTANLIDHDLIEKFKKEYGNSVSQFTMCKYRNQLGIAAKGNGHNGNGKHGDKKTSPFFVSVKNRLDQMDERLGKIEKMLEDALIEKREEATVCE